MLQLTVLPRRTGSPADPEAGRGCHHKHHPTNRDRSPSPRSDTRRWRGGRRPGAQCWSQRTGSSPHTPPKVTRTCLGIQALWGHCTPSVLLAKTALRAGWRLSNRQTRRSPDRSPEVRGSQVPDPTQRASANGMQGLAAASRPPPSRLRGLVETLSRPGCADAAFCKRALASA